MTEFQMLITWLAGIGGFIVAFLALMEHKKSRKEKRYWIRREKEDEVIDMKIITTIKDFQHKIKKDIKDIVSNSLIDYTTIEKNDKDNQQIKEYINEIKKEMKEHNEQFADYQKQNITKEIVKYADDLRKGKKRTRNSFKYLANCYKKYKDLGGNNYIDEEWEYIKEAMKNETD